MPFISTFMRGNSPIGRKWPCTCQSDIHCFKPVFLIHLCSRTPVGFEK